MEYGLIAVCSFFASLIAFYTGFGLGTILMPVMAIFLPLPLAIAITALVHLFNNACRTLIFLSKVDWPVVWRFGTPALLGAAAGVWLLKKFSMAEPIFRYSLGEVTWLHLTIGLLLIGLSSFELAKGESTKKRSLLLGGALSGFFGGLSGNQGAFRSLYLAASLKEKEAFIGTSAAISTLVDLTRASLYGITFASLIASADALLIGTALISSLAAILLALFLLPKISMAWIQKWVIALVYLLGILMILGII